MTSDLFLRGGYDPFDMALSIYHALGRTRKCMWVLKTKKQYQTFVESLVELLCKDGVARETFLKWQGSCLLEYDPTTGQVKEVLDTVDELYR